MWRVRPERKLARCWNVVKRSIDKKAISNRIHPTRIVSDK